MPKSKNRMTEQEQSRRFEDEVKKRKEAGEFDPDAADAALERIVRRAGAKTTSPPD